MALFVRGRRFTVIGAMSWVGLLDFMIIEGAAGAENILNFPHNCLVRRLCSTQLDHNT
jgi:hypothetical protein